MSELNVNVKCLTVRELHQALAQRGLDISYSSLSELLNTGDIAEQLAITGGGNARQILPETCDILTEFWPLYREKRGRLPQAPDLLRSFLRMRGDDSLVPVREFALSPKPPSGNGAILKPDLKDTIFEQGGEAIELLRRLVAAVEARQSKQTPVDRWIGAEEAMALLHCSRRALGRRVRPVARETWSYLDIQAYMRRRRELGV